ncbi:unnamed protein product [Adineta steineri]|uniref:EGF-like domain-containing protein n=1 Tax=Adineta steineri TaxID=433720 RepID=A0A814ZKL6_9BILA|nr:unnamed protein product [Adineta steineri]CAF3929135.1 unnamed protein product [Adineta steineri]
MHWQLLYFIILLSITVIKSKTIDDCFYASIIVDRDPNEKLLFRTNYLTPYCQHPLSIDSINKIQGYIENTYTFKNLSSKGITSEDLLQWSISFDIIEQYSIYLIKNDTKFDEFIFNNCSSLWFGSNCQYTFNFSMSIESFGDFVNASFKARKQYKRKILIYTCYLHLSGCYRGPEPMCLDWREICNGKIDCTGENFGIDEEYCNELELTECNEDEYRCHNGAQCIPLEFFRDGVTSKDCLDGTDEAENLRISDFWVKDYSLDCIELMIFACEERTCRQPHAFSCGDGSCSPLYPYINLVEDNPEGCPSTGRAVYYSQAIYKSAKQYPDDCYLLLFCKLGFYDFLKNDTYNITDCSSENLSLKNCTLEYLSFPREPIFNGYFQPMYYTRYFNKPVIDKWPAYICTDPRLCSHLPNATRHINGLHCRPAPKYDSDVPFLSIALREDATICALMGNINEYKSNSSLFYCEKSRKYISKHRLIDGIPDCYYDEDESYNASCSLNDTQRFNCTSETKCLSPVGIGRDQPRCKDEEDEKRDNSEILVYSRLCNHVLSYPELSPEDGEDDETNCEWWPCHTPYTRCDNIFQCANGIDELNCPNINCNINEFKCQIKKSSNYYCISQEYIYEKPVDCINHDFHSSLWRTIFYSNNLTFNINQQYISWKEKTCLTKNDICDDSSTNDQHLICNIVEKESIRFNSDFSIDLYNNGTLCQLADNDAICDPGFYYFSTWNLGYFPPIINSTLSTSQPFINTKLKKKALKINTSIELIEYCNRGIVIFEGKSYEKTCLCPPNYYGDRCQWQNQRVSLTLQIRPLGSYEKKLSIYHIFIYLIDEQNGIIHNYEEIKYIQSIDCNTKYNRYLLYPDRPKNLNYTYSVRIDIYEKVTLSYYGSWHLSIRFPFLPVNRISTQIRIPLEKSQLLTNCSIQCETNGKCFKYINSTKEFCHCDQGYSGRSCNITYQHLCSSGSIPVNSSICLCPLNKFGSKCYLQHKHCQSNNNLCQNNGQCISDNNHIHHDGFICLCPENFTGSYCEFQSNKININFKIDSIPSFIIAHYIIAFEDKTHERITTFKKIPFDQYSIELYYTTPFNLLFIEFEKNYYLSIVREQPTSSENIFTNINQDYKCENITKLLNSTILNYKNLRRLKYYQLPCIENLKLKCFYDEQYMCVCDKNRYSNCFDFDHNTFYNCQGNNLCGKNGECFQNNITCPSISICKCDKCYYGSKCELNTIGFSSSLDIIFGYHIKPFISFTKQSTAVKITASITILMLIFSIINGLLSILTFKNKSILKVGCGIYLLTNSFISILTITIFTIKYFQLIIFQMKSITNLSFINFSCILTDVLLKILLSFGDWLNVCVAIERTFTAIQGISFNQLKSKSIAKYVIPIIFCLITISYIHDPISRQILDDNDEQRIWCILEYSTNLKKYDKFINIFHILIPFILNILSAICIIIQVFRIRLKIKKKSKYKQLLVIQIQQHKHLLISPCILIVLSIPRLIISFLSGCMKSIRNPWIYLIGYYISFIPPLLIIILFILPSKTYKKEFISIIGKINFFSK